MSDRTHTRMGGQNGTTSSASPIEPEIIAPEPPIGQVYPYQHPIPPGHMLVRRDVAIGIGGFVLGAIAGALIVRELTK